MAWFIGAAAVLALALLFGWAFLLLWAAALLWPGAGQDRSRGVRLLLGGLLWMICSPGTWFSLPLRMGPRFVAPDGVSTAWVRQGLGYSHWVCWRSPRGDGNLLLGMPPGTFYPDYSLPADLAWLPTGDAFYVGWAGGASPHDPPVVEVATGTCRHLTPEEVAWLLQPGRLDERAHDYLQGN